MKHVLNLAVLTAALGLTFAATPADAAVATHIRYMNAADICQSFTPGPANTIRNRVVGAENVGVDTLAVVCAFSLTTNGAAGNTNLTEVGVWFTNGTTAPVTVTCTMLTGAGAVSPGGYAVTKTTTSIAAGAISSLLWSAADNPTSGATDLGNLLVGVNCMLPQGVTINAGRAKWSADNGV